MAARLATYLVVGIVAATLIAGLIVGAQRDDNDGPIDLIIHNARIYTADQNGTMAEAVAVRGNQILKVGSNREITRLARPQTTVIDAQGAAALPGFNDSHVHLIGGGLGMDRIDLLGAATLEEIRGRIASWASANAERPWVLGRGWYYQPFPDGLPTRQMLDALVPDRPAQLLSYDGHTAWVNSKALALAKITKRTPDPPNGAIVRDPRTGEPTGVLKEAAITLVSGLVPPPSRADRARALRTAMAEANRFGITSVQNAGGPADYLDIFEEARREGDLVTRVYSAVTADGRLSDADLDRLDAVRERHQDDAIFKTGALKFSLDGVVEGHTAAMLEPYANRPTAGAPSILPDDLNRTVRLADAKGWQVMTHAVGDRAVRMALNAYQHAARSNPAPQRGRRHRVEHVEIAAEEDIARFGPLGAIASMMPFHGLPSPTRLEVWSKNVGPERAARGWAYGDIRKARGRLAFGSDWPYGSLDPMQGLHVAVNRATADGEPEGGWNPEQRLALKAAIDAYTSGAAWASFDEQRKGTIAPGMLADIVVLTRDIFSAPPSTLADTQVAATIFDGKVVYRKPARPTN
jgi:predicted amidohydrolase YtcJ